MSPEPVRYGEDNWIVFVSHAGSDTWVARQIATHITAKGAVPFLDEADIAKGEDFEERILTALDRANELVVLLTPWSLKRPYVWMEIGAAWIKRILIVGVLHGITAEELQAQAGVPIQIKSRNLVNINDLDKYFEQLGERVAINPGKDKGK